jgi:hypothetical protein
VRGASPKSGAGGDRGYTGAPRGCGGIGRRARFRSVWGKPRGGSSPLIRIATASGLSARSSAQTGRKRARGRGSSTPQHTSHWPTSKASAGQGYAMTVPEFEAFIKSPRRPSCASLSSRAAGTCGTPCRPSIGWSRRRLAPHRRPVIAGRLANCAVEREHRDEIRRVRKIDPRRCAGGTQIDSRSAFAAACRRSLTWASSRAARSMRSCWVSARSCWLSARVRRAFSWAAMPSTARVRSASWPATIAVSSSAVTVPEI